MDPEEIERRVNAILQRFDAVVARVDQVDRRGRVYAVEHAKALKDDAAAERDQALAEVQTEVDKLAAASSAAREALELHPDKAKAPLAWASADERARAEALRGEVRRQVENSSGDELHRQIRLAAASGDWVTARVWKEEVGAFAISHARPQLAELTRDLDQAAKDPSHEVAKATLEREFDEAFSIWKKAAAVFAPLRQDELQSRLASNRAYSRF